MPTERANHAKFPSLKISRLRNAGRRFIGRNRGKTGHIIKNKPPLRNRLRRFYRVKLPIKKHTFLAIKVALCLFVAQNALRVGVLFLFILSCQKAEPDAD